MRLLIAGSRSWSPTDDEITIALSCLPSTGDPVEAVVSGGARGADLAGERWAKAHGLTIDAHPAEWERLGKRAGFVRNEAMGDACSHALIFRDDGESNGTDHMLSVLRRLGRPHVLVTRKGIEYVPAPNVVMVAWRSLWDAAIDTARRKP